MEVRIVSEWGENTITWNEDDPSSVSNFTLIRFSYFILFECWFFECLASSHLFLGYHMWYYWFQTFHKWISTLAAESRIIVPAAISVQNATFSRTSYVIRFPIPMPCYFKNITFISNALHIIWLSKTYLADLY